METIETLDFILQVFQQFFKGLLHIIIAPFQGLGIQFDFNYYSKLVDQYVSTNGNGAFPWFIVVLSFVVMFAIVAGFLFLLFLAIKKILKVVKTFRNQDRLLKEVGRLNKEVAFYHDQMDKHLKKDLKDMEKKDEEDDGGDHRFSKLL